MGVRLETIVLDDLDGQQLPEDTPAVRLALGDRSWDLYLSPANLLRLQRVLDQFVEGADPAASSMIAPGPASAEAIRRWATTQGHVVPATGRVPKEVRRAYELAQQ